MQTSPFELLIALERIEQLLRSELRPLAGEVSLQWVHLRMLDYLARANDYSNTPLAVAEYLDLTKGTVSQSLILLESKGLLRRSEDSKDRRIVRLALTEAGRALVENVARKTAEFVGECACEQALAVRLIEFLRCLQQKSGRRSFGLCADCGHHLAIAPGVWRCGLTGETLDAEARVKICRDFTATARERPVGREGDLTW